MRFFLDNNVPDSVGHELRAHGHEVVLLREVLATDTPDQVVATVSEDLGMVLVSYDKDFKIIAPRIPRGHRSRFGKLSRISLGCKEPQAAERMKVAMSLVENEFEIAQSSQDKRIHIFIGDGVIRTYR